MRQALHWQWPQRRVERQDSPGRKARTLAHEWAGTVTDVGKMIGAWFPPAGKAAEAAKALAGRHTADLNISALDGPEALAPIESTPPPVVARSGDGPVFFDGLTATFTLFHNGGGKDPIVLEWVDLGVAKFVPGPDPYFSFDREGEKVFGAGLIPLMVFFLEVGKDGPKKARRQIQGEGGKRRLVVARGDNVLDTEPEPAFYSFTPGEQPLKIRFVLSALDAGYYEARLRFLYRIGRELRGYESELLRIYTDGRWA